MLPTKKEEIEYAWITHCLKMFANQIMFRMIEERFGEMS